MSTAFRRPTLQVAVGASVVFHGLVAFALWESQLRGPPSAHSEPSRIAIKLVSTAAPQSVEGSPAIPSAAPVRPPPVDSAPLRKVKPPTEPPTKKPSVQRATASPSLSDSAPPVERMPGTANHEKEAPNAATAPEVDASVSVAGELVAAVVPVPQESAAPADAMPDYVAEVRRRIESKKRYPAMARKRREEGRVLARISISPSGTLRGVELKEEAPLSLLRATRSAIERAAPFPSPPRGELRVEIYVLWQVRR